jgi:MFS family permease
MQGILRNRNILLLWLGQTVSMLGDAVYFIALPLLVYRLSGSKTLTGVVMFAYNLPFFVIGAFAGVLVDRFDRRRLMIISDLARGLILLTIPLMFWLGVLDVAALCVTAFLVASFSTVFNPARDSIIPALTGGESLMQANSLIQTSQFIAMIFGAAAASALIALVGPVHAFTADAAALFVSLAMIAAIVVPAVRKAPRSARRITALKSLFAAARYVVRHKRLGQLLLLTAVDNLFIMGPAVVGILFFVKNTLGKPDEFYAYIEGVFAAGIIVGMILLNRFARNARKGLLVIVGMILDGATYIPFFWCRSFELLVVLMFVHSVCVSLIVVPRAALLQQHVPQKRLGRIFALLNLTVAGLTALSAGLTGIAAEVISPPTLFLVAGLGGATCGLIALAFRSLRSTA